VNTNCPTDISQSNCQGCYPYSVTTCLANQEACDANINEACPYKICRKGILSYCILRIKPFTYGMLSLACLQILMIILNSMLICHHPRDTMQQILIKSGVEPPKRNGVGGDTAAYSTVSPEYEFDAL